MINFQDEIRKRAKADGLVIVDQGYNWNIDSEMILLAFPGKEQHVVAYSISRMEILQNSDEQQAKVSKLVCSAVDR